MESHGSPPSNNNNDNNPSGFGNFDFDVNNNVAFLNNPQQMQAFLLASHAMNIFQTTTNNEQHEPGYDAAGHATAATIMNNNNSNDHEAPFGLVPYPATRFLTSSTVNTAGGGNTGTSTRSSSCTGTGIPFYNAMLANNNNNHHHHTNTNITVAAPYNSSFARSNNNNNSNHNNMVALTAPSATKTTPAPAVSVSTPTPATTWIPTLFGKRVDLPCVTDDHQTLMNKPAVAASALNKPAKRRGSNDSAGSSLTSVSVSVGVPSDGPGNRNKRPRTKTGTANNGTATTATTVSSSSKTASLQQLPPVSEDEGDRRRQDRNLREQLRSHQINYQIAELREILVKANLRFKPDKFSTLAMVAQYITALQTKQQALEQDHEKLLATITTTAQVMSQQYLGSSGCSSSPENTDNAGNDCCDSVLFGLSATLLDTRQQGNKQESLREEDNDATTKALGIDYKTIFENICGPAALFGVCITSIDGRFLDCNRGFEEVSGFRKSELLPLDVSEQGQVGEDGIERNLSLFNILTRLDMERVFTNMSTMLKRPPTPPPLSGSSRNNNKTSAGDDNMLSQNDTYTTYVTLCRKPNQQVQLTLSLIRTADETKRPSMFNCTLIPQGNNGTYGVLSIPVNDGPLTATG